ncbi:hypothetical protein Tco_0820652 [Tanacetum coccineum]|uniref:Reverse transcriptase domain-containing protein n=1 Tax=Tanacetum coccineum TaxID=301880 RepID=A0ABQ5AAZ6_9ASTR
MRGHEDEIPKTAFRMRYRRYEFTAMPFWIDQCTSDFHGRNESGGARVAFKDEFGAAEEREVSCEAQQGRRGVKRKLFGSCRNNMGNEPILALPEGSEKICSDAWSKGDVRTLIMEEAHATKYSVRLGVNEAVARHEVSVSSIPDKDGMYIEVLERDVEVVRNTSRYEDIVWKRRLVACFIVKRVKLIVEMKLLGFSVGDHVMMNVLPWKGVVRFGKKGELAPRLFARLIEEFGFALHRVRSRLVSDSTTRDVEWEPIEEERLEEPKEGWMLGESKKRSIRISSRMVIVGLVPRSPRSSVNSLRFFRI